MPGRLGIFYCPGLGPLSPAQWRRSIIHALRTHSRVAAARQKSSIIQAVGHEFPQKSPWGGLNDALIQCIARARRMPFTALNSLSDQAGRAARSANIRNDPCGADLMCTEADCHRLPQHRHLICLRGCHSDSEGDFSATRFCQLIVGVRWTFPSSAPTKAATGCTSIIDANWH